MNSIPVNVANRKSLFDRLQSSISQHRKTEKGLALLLVNINHFREFNITHGYPIGDLLLVEFYHRLNSLCREQDYVTRMGNSDFLVVLSEVLNEGHASLAAIKLQTSLNEPFDLDGSEIAISADVGIALYPHHDIDLEGLLNKTEIALIDARKQRQSYAVYSEYSQKTEYNTAEIESELQLAIEKDQFELYFQPQVYLETGQVFGAEALIRWENGDKGFISPELFIPIAERSGQIYDITKWTINAALWLIEGWPKTEMPLKVAVNISTKMLGEPGLLEAIKNALNIYGTNFQQLTLEITESALVEDMSASFKYLDELKSMGLNISIDDFGTGYSSMAYFKNIPADELKIDKSFVLHMLENPMDQHIVKTIINLAQGFGLKVVAEGIENQESLELLKELGCDIGQGYYLARPLPQDDFIQWLNDYQKNAKTNPAADQ